MFSERTLAEIKERINIVDLVGEYVQLKKAGTGFTGLCPFHKEKTPSFHVHPIKQIFHCFGCHKGGNVFTFLTELEGMRFPEVVERLAKRCGVQLEVVPSARYARKPPVVQGQDRLFAANELAARFFQHLLLERPEYRFALDYVGSRGLTKKTIDKFQIGVSPRGWNTLMNLLEKRGFTFAEMVAAGLVIPKEGKPNEGYDRFRERLMFPIRDVEGNIVGFGARLLKDEPRKDGTPQPKYINSPESPLFAKRRMLYGHFENQRGIRTRGEALIVEGYMDVVGLHECGVDNALATMGTALTEEHCSQIKNMTRRVVTVFDPDAAGTDAWRRSVHTLMGSGIFAKDLTLPEGQDPDDFVLKNGAETFYSLCEKAPRQVTKMLREFASQGPLSEEKTAKVLAELTPILVASRNLPDRAMLWDDISLLLNLSPATLKSLVESAAPKFKPRAEEKPGPARPPQRPMPPRPGPSAPRPPALEPLSKDLLTAVVQHPDAFLACSKQDWVAAVPDPKVRRWLEELAKTGNRQELDRALETLLQFETEPALVSLASAGLMRDTDTPRQENGKELLAALVARVQKRRKEQEIRALTAQVRLSQRLGDEPEVLRLLARIRELRAS